MGFKILPAPPDDNKKWREEKDHESRPDDVHADIYCSWRACVIHMDTGFTWTRDVVSMCLSMCT